MTWRYVDAPDAHASLLRRVLGVWSYRRLLRRMAERELRQRYVGSAIGLAWAAVYPLVLVGFYTVIFTFVFRARLSPGAAPAQYALYVVSGLLPWIAFSEVASRATQIMAEHRGLVKFAMFPVHILPLTSLYATGVSQAIGLAGALAIAALVRGGLGPQVALLVPLVVLQTAFLAGVAWLLGALGAVIRDVKELVAVALMVGMFITPIFYAEHDAPAVLKPLIELNPMAHLVRLYRAALIGTEPAGAVSLVVFALAAAVVPLIGFRVFERTRVLLSDIL